MLEHTYVALTSAGRQPSDEAQLRCIQDEPCASLQDVMLQDAYSASLTVAGAEVYGVFAILPPKPKEPKQNGLSAELGLPGSWLVGLWRNMQRFLARMQWAHSLTQFGVLAPLRMQLWMAKLDQAADKSRMTGICSPDYHDIQIMCVAKHLQGQGLGAAVMEEAFKVARELGAVGLKGICQSNGTRSFYEKCGFRSAMLLQHAHNWRHKGSVRTEWLVAWRNEDAKTLIERDSATGAKSSATSSSMCL